MVADTVAVVASVAGVASVTVEAASIVFAIKAFIVEAASVAFVGYKAILIQFTRFGRWHGQGQNSLEGIATAITEGVVAVASMELVAGIVTAAWVAASIIVVAWEVAAWVVAIAFVVLVHRT